jgi:hypothetical protein
VWVSYLLYYGILTLNLIITELLCHILFHVSRAYLYVIRSGS